MKISCPTRCTQKRGRNYNLSEKNTFDTETNKCSFCGFYKLPASAKLHGAGFRKASELGGKNHG